jgi:hypothetical protein
MDRFNLNKHINLAAANYFIKADDELSDDELSIEEDALFDAIRQSMNPETEEGVWQFIQQNLASILSGSGIALTLMLNQNFRNWLKRISIGFWNMLKRSGLSSSQALQKVILFLRDLFRSGPNNPNNPLSQDCMDALRGLKDIFLTISQMPLETSITALISIITETISLAASIVAKLASCTGAGAQYAYNFIYEWLLTLLGEGLSAMGLTQDQIKQFIKKLVEWILNGAKVPEIPPLPYVLPFSLPRLDPNCVNPRNYLKDLRIHRIENNEYVVPFLAGLAWAALIVAAVAAVLAALPAILAGSTTVGAVLAAAGITALGISQTASAAGYEMTEEQIEAFILEKAKEAAKCKGVSVEENSDTPEGTPEDNQTNPALSPSK